MTKLISYANQKGGVGKTTLCMQSTFELAKRGFNVLVIDFDPQGNSSSRLAGDQPLSGNKSADLFASHLETVSVMSCNDRIDLIHTPKNDTDLALVESHPLAISHHPKRHLTSLIDRYDYVLIDCPPALGNKLVAALILSTHVVCPVKLSGFAVDGIEGLLRTIIGVRDSHNPQLQIAGIIINDMDNSVAQRKAQAALQQAVPHLLFEHRIMHRSPLDAATSLGVPISKLNYGHVAAKEVRCVVDELLERVKQ